MGSLTKGMEISERFRSDFTYRYFVRDTLSLDYCKRLKMKNVQLCPDLSWCYDCDRNKKTWRNCSMCVMLNFKGFTYASDDELYRSKLLKKIESVLKELEEVLNRKVMVLICYQVEEDKAFAEILYTKLREKFNCQKVEHRLRLYELQNYYATCGFHLSNRMHSLLVGYKYGSLPIGVLDISNHEKIVSTFRDNGLEELLIDINSEKNRESIAEILLNADTLFERLIEREMDNTKIIKSTLDAVFID